MATTPAQLVSAVNTELSVNTQNKIWSTNTILGYINQAIRRVEIDMRLETNDNAPSSSTISLVQGTTEYAMPSDFAELDMVQLNNGQTVYTLYPIEFAQTLLLNPNSAQSQPTNYYIRGTNMGFYQIPDSSYTVTLYYKKLVTSLTSGGASLGLADIYVPAIVKYAAYLAWSSKRGNEGIAESKKQQYQEEIGIQQSFILSQDPNSMIFRSDRKRFDINSYGNWSRSLYYP